MGSLHRISDSLDYKFDRIFRISEFLLPFFVSPLPSIYIPVYTCGYILTYTYWIESWGRVVVVKIREKFGDGTRKLPIQELAYSYASW